MAKLKIYAGTTDKIVHIFVQNSSSISGGGLTGLAFNTAGLTAYYLREGAAADAAIALVTATLGTWVSGGFVAVDATYMPGVYELHLPNAVLASGAQSVVIMLQGAPNMVPVILEIELDAVNYQSSTAFVSSVAVGSIDSGVEAPSGYLANVQAPADFLANETFINYLLGLTGLNQGVRNQTYDTSTPPNLLSCDICYYNSAVNATNGGDGITGLVHKWHLACSYTSGVLTAQALTLVS